MTDVEHRSTSIRGEGPVEPAWFAALAQWSGPVCATVTVPLDPDTVTPDRARATLAALVRQVTIALRRRSDVSPEAAASVLAGFDDALGRERLHRAGARGLVLVSGPGLHAELAVPTPVRPAATVGTVVDVLPLLPARRSGDRFAVLCLSERDVRFLEGDRAGLHLRALADLPRSLDQALGYDDRECRIGGAHGSGNRPRRRAATVHGASADVHDERVRRFLRRVDYAVVAHLGTTEPVPVVLAGSDEMVRRYAAASHYPRLVPLTTAAPDRRPASELHRIAWPLASHQLRVPLDRAIAEARELRGTGLTTEHPAEAADAAAQGQVAALVVAERWCRPTADVGGALDPEAARLVNLAVVHTWRRHGTVWITPDRDLGSSGVLARLRY